MKAKKREERCPTCNSPRKSVRRIVRHDYGTVPTLESRCTDPWHSPAPVEALKGNVKDWRKAYEDVQRELEEAFKVVQGYQVQHNVICSVESHNKITECPCENCIAARALARSTEEAKK